MLQETNSLDALDVEYHPLDTSEEEKVEIMAGICRVLLDVRARRLSEEKEKR
jgi:hypothetical protein